MQNEIKVLMIGPARSVNGGISAVVNNYYEVGLDKKVHLKYIGTMEDGSKFHKLFIAIKAFFQYFFCVRKYDIVHVNMASDVSIYRKMIFIWIAVWRKKKIIIHQHGGNFEQFYYEECSHKKRKLIQKTLNQAEYLLVIAPYLKELFSDIVDSDKIIVFPNSIAVPAYKEKDYTAQKILFLGRLCKEKGIQELLDAVEELKKTYSGLQLYLGGYWVHEDLRQQADKNKEWIKQLGWVKKEEKRKYLEECNIFVMPSYFEGQSVSLAEGMAYSCACVASNVGGIPQMIVQGKTGILVESKNTESLKKGIELLLKDTELQKNMGQAARTKIDTEFNLDKNLEKLLKIYEKIVV